jgi:hypothetical protein
MNLATQVYAFGATPVAVNCSLSCAMTASAPGAVTVAFLIQPIWLAVVQNPHIPVGGCRFAACDAVLLLVRLVKKGQIEAVFSCTNPKLESWPVVNEQYYEANT